MNPNEFWQRATAVPLSRRFYQLLNGGLTWVAGGPLRLVHVVEYPRCGGTWVRHLLQSALGIPQYAYDRLITSGTIIQTHSLPSLRIRRPIVVVRDPRDAMVSFYYKKVFYDQRSRGGREIELPYYRHDPSRPPPEDFAEFLASHLRQPDHPRFSYRQFVAAWIDRPGICLVKYEDCKADAVAQLARMVEFLGAQVAADTLTRAVNENRFEMRTRQRSGQTRAPGEADASQFERKGVVGDWRNLFTPAAARLFSECEGWTLRRLGYESDDAWISTAAAHPVKPPGRA